MAMIPACFLLRAEVQPLHVKGDNATPGDRCVPHQSHHPSQSDMSGWAHAARAWLGVILRGQRVLLELCLDGVYE